MLKVVLVDLVDTRAAPAAAAALAVLAELDTADGQPLRVAMLGDTTDAVLRRYVESSPDTAFGPALAALDTAPADGLAITADAGRAAESRATGLAAVCLGVDVPGWAGVPALVARLVDPDGGEAATFANSLRAHGQLAEPGAAATAATHRIDEDGQIRRERFRSI